MKFIPKHIILFSGCIIFIFIGYFIFQNFNSSPLEAVNISLSQSDKETNTGKLSKDISHSGGEWGGNPFATGITSTGEVVNQSKLEFKNPDTEWKTRTLSGVTYEFGKGNPREVAPKLSEYMDMQDYFHGYLVRPKTERLLVEFLSSPMLAKVIHQCGPLIQPDPYSDSQIERTLPASLYTANFSLESILFIDPKTRRKMINWDVLAPLGYVIYQIRNSTIDRPIEQSLVKQCLVDNDIPLFYRLLNLYMDISNSAANDSEENAAEALRSIGQ